MLPNFDFIRELNEASIAIRMLLAFLCGGLIGIEREYKRRPAGFRTHILICMGAAVTTMTSQYLTFELGYYTDISRMGAQVVAGVGFIGAGTIIVTHRQNVKGLTTAAGLWTSAIIGLAIGAGFYEGAVMATGLIMIVEIVIFRLEYHLLQRSPEIVFYIEYTDRSSLDRVLSVFQERNIKILNLEVTRATQSEHHSACAIITLRLNKRTTSEKLQTILGQIEGVYEVESL